MINNHFCCSQCFKINKPVQELGRTAYKNTKMTILGSRDQYCVHQSAKKFERGVNEACNLMLGGTDLTKVGKTLGKDKRNGLCFQNRL